MSIKLKLEGFDDLIKQIEKAGGKIDSATTKCLEKSAAIMENELKYQMEKADKDGTLSRLISNMPPSRVENDYGKITARVGYEKGVFDPKNLTDAYKFAFLNYGTPHRKEHGIEAKRDFIRKAKRRARPKIQKQQEETLNEILRGLKK